MNDTFAYDGETEPETLNRYVVFRASALHCVSAAFLVAIFVWIAVFIAGIAVLTVTEDWTAFGAFRTAVRGISLMTFVFAARYFFGKWFDVSTTVNRNGISIARGDKVLRQCAWDDMTVKQSKSLGMTSAILCDQFGKPFSEIRTTSEDPDARVAELVIRTVTRRLAIADRASRSLPPVRKVSLWLLLIPGAIGISAMPILRACGTAFVDSMADPASSLVIRSLWLAGLVGCGVFVGVGILSLHMLQVPALAWGHAWYRSKHRNLTQFVADRKGKLDPVDLIDNVWYRYVDPAGLKANEPNLSGGIVFMALGAAIVAVGFLGPKQIGFYLSVAIVAVAMLVGGGLMVRQSFRIRRPLSWQVRRVGDAYELLDQTGTLISCAAVRSLKSTTRNATSFGLVSITLRDKQGRYYRVDPRFLFVAVD